ncbi:MAG TPA: MBL fold metallo-hydrolase [Roseiflexaceae bacterium]|nr:MBL fold metallo-hydrolase [Roseiflexaceae bacterium]
MQGIATPGHTPQPVSFCAPARGIPLAGDSLGAAEQGRRYDDTPRMRSYEQARVGPQAGGAGTRRA